MKSFFKIALVGILSATTLTAGAESAKSEKQANRAVEVRQAMFTLLGRNMGPLGAMARGKMPMNVELVKTNATRINQLSLMIDDYTATDTSAFKVKTEALNDVWTKRSDFTHAIDKLTKASANLQKAASGGDIGAIKKAIGQVGKSCGGCHDNFKAE